MGRVHSTSGSATPGQRHGSPGRLRAFLRLAPVGAFWLLHLWANHVAMQGRVAFEVRALRALALPAVAWILIVAIDAPLCITLARKAVHVSRSRSGEVATDFITLTASICGAVFVAYLSYVSRVRVALGGASAFDLYPELVGALSATTDLGVPLAALGFIAGFASLAVHLAQTLRSTWPILARRDVSETSARLRVASNVAGVVSFAAMVNGVVFLATGVSLV